MEVNERAKTILKTLIERYIRDGTPVGSKVLAEESNLMLSSASIRSIMADLEAAGLLISPHTSAGRVPTELGYRLFVDQFVTIKPLDPNTLAEWRSQLLAHSGGEQLVRQTSALLSSATRLAGMVSLPKRKSLILEQLQFIQLSFNRILVVLVVNGGEVQNRVIHTASRLDARELERAAQFIVEHFSGKDLLDIREEMLAVLKQHQKDMDYMMSGLMEMIEENDPKRRADYVLAGETNLFDTIEQGNYRRLKQLFDAFDQKRTILHLLDKSLAAEELKIFIGSESGHEALMDYSVITAPYKANGEVVGVLGVVGPQRMPYQQVASAVDVTAKLLTQILEQ